MGSTLLADNMLQGAIGGANVSFASVASNGAGATLGNIGQGIFRAPQALTLVAAWYEPTGADSGVTNTSSYRDLPLINGGADGTGTTVLATLHNNTSQGSNTTKAMTLAATPTVPAGSVIAAKHATVGGAETNGTVLV